MDIFMSPIKTKAENEETLLQSLVDKHEMQTGDRPDMILITKDTYYLVPKKIYYGRIANVDVFVCEVKVSTQDYEVE
jgi:hypothetical protein